MIYLFRKTLTFKKILEKEFHQKSQCLTSQKYLITIRVGVSEESEHINKLK